MTHLRLSAFGLAAGLLLTACGNTADLDWDLRSGSAATASAAGSATGPRPVADQRGIISYPDYQVAVARRGDTVASVAARIGIDAASLASFNALRPEDALRDGEILALPSRVATAPASGTGAVIGSGTGPVDVSAIATTALDRVGGETSAAPGTPEPVRHQVKRGETAFSIARSYNVSAKALGEWNGLGADLAVREGQYLIIPTATAAASIAETATTTAPGAGSPTPQPPSAKEPLPDEETAPSATKPEATPDSPDLGTERTAATAAQFVMPVDGQIIRGYVKKKNDGIDIAAAAGTPVKAAASGTVAAVTTDTEGTLIVVISHPDGLLTVYAGVAGVELAKGATVSRGQTIGKVPATDPSFVHFEVRKGVDSLDPVPYLQ